MKTNSNFKNMLWALVIITNLVCLIIALFVVGWHFSNEKGTDITGKEQVFQDIIALRKTPGTGSYVDVTYGLLISALLLASLGMVLSLLNLFVGLGQKNGQPLKLASPIVDYTLLGITLVGTILVLIGTAIYFVKTITLIKLLLQQESFTNFRAETGYTTLLYLLLIIPSTLTAFPLTSGNWKTKKHDY